MTDYHDRWIDIDERGITIRAYFFPWGTKRIAPSRVRSVSQVDLGAFNGRARIWGTVNPTVWASLDPGRPGRRSGFLIDSGRRVRSLVTPQRPDAAADALRAHLPDGVMGARSRSRPAPVV